MDDTLTVRRGISDKGIGQGIVLKSGMQEESTTASSAKNRTLGFSFDGYSFLWRESRDYGFQIPSILLTSTI